MNKANNVTKADLKAVESPPLTEKLLARMRPVSEVHPDIPAQLRGPQKSPTKRSTTIRLDTEVLDFFKAQGKGWQTKVNAVLHKYVDSHRTA